MNRWAEWAILNRHKGDETRDGKETRSGLACGILNTMYTAAINSFYSYYQVKLRYIVDLMIMVLPVLP